MRGTKWFPVTLVQGTGTPASAPPFAVCGLAPFDATTPAIGVIRPRLSSDAGAVVLGDTGIPLQAVQGEGTLDDRVVVGYEPSDGEPKVGEEWGTKTGSWFLRKGYSGFRILGGAGQNRVNAQRLPPRCCTKIPVTSITLATGCGSGSGGGGGGGGIGVGCVFAIDVDGALWTVCQATLAIYPPSFGPDCVDGTSVRLTPEAAAKVLALCNANGGGVIWNPCLGTDASTGGGSTYYSGCATRWDGSSTGTGGIDDNAMGICERITIYDGTRAYADASGSVTVDSKFDGTGYPFTKVIGDVTITGKMIRCPSRTQVGWYFEGTIVSNDPDPTQPTVYPCCFTQLGACSDANGITQEIKTDAGRYLKITTPCGTIKISMAICSTVPPSGWNCVSMVCQPSTSGVGTYATEAACINAPCGSNSQYNCIDGNCQLAAGAGTYPSLAACQSACSPPPPPPPLPPPPPCCSDFNGPFGSGAGTLVIPDGPNAGTYSVDVVGGETGGFPPCQYNINGLPTGTVIGLAFYGGVWNASVFSSGSCGVASVSCSGAAGVASFSGSCMGSTGNITVTVPY